MQRATILEDNVHRPSILFVVSSLHVGGTEKHVSLIARRLNARGYSASVYCLREIGIVGEALAGDGIEVIGPPETAPRGRRTGPVDLVKLARSAARLRGLMTAKRPEIVAYYTPEAYIIGSLATPITPPHYAIVSRRCLNNYQIRHPILARAERFLHRRMDLIIGNSLPVVDQLITEEGAPPERVALIYNGVEIEPTLTELERADLRRAHGVAPESVVISVVANLLPYKGHHDLVSALALLRPELLETVVVQLIGRDAGMGDELIKPIRKLGLEGKIRFLGQRHDVRDLLALSDIAVSCSHEEGFSNAVIEAMSCGLPVVATDVGGSSYAVRNGVDGFVVPARNPAELGRAISRLVEDRKLCEAFGAAGRRRAEEEFSIKRCVDRYDRLLQTLVEGC